MSSNILNEIRNAKKKRGLSFDYLAKKVGVSRNTLYRNIAIAKGKTEPESKILLCTALKLIKVLNLKIEL